MIRNIRRTHPKDERAGAVEAIVKIELDGYERALILRITDRGIYCRGERQKKEILLYWADLGRALNSQWGFRELLGRKKLAS